MWGGNFLLSFWAGALKTQVPRQPDEGQSCRELSEHIVTTGDIGLPASVMKASFPQVSSHCPGCKRAARHSLERGTACSHSSVQFLYGAQVWHIAVQFSKAMEGLPERWWFGHHHNDACAQRFNKHESKKAMKVGLQRCRLSSSMPCHAAACFASKSAATPG